MGRRVSVFLTGATGTGGIHAGASGCQELEKEPEGRGRGPRHWPALSSGLSSSLGIFNGAVWSTPGLASGRSLSVSLS